MTTPPNDPGRGQPSGTFGHSGQNRCICGESNGGEGNPFIVKAAHKFRRNMLGIGSAAAIAAKEDFVA